MKLNGKTRGASGSSLRLFCISSFQNWWWLLVRPGLRFDFRRSTFVVLGTGLGIFRNMIHTWSNTPESTLLRILDKKFFTKTTVPPLCAESVFLLRNDLYLGKFTGNCVLTSYRPIMSNSNKSFCTLNFSSFVFTPLMFQDRIFSFVTCGPLKNPEDSMSPPLRHLCRVSVLWYQA